MMSIAETENKYGPTFSKLDKLVQEEIDKADDIHGDFSSMHEGSSVLLKQVEGAENVLKGIKKLYAEIWESVKNEDYSAQLPLVAKLHLKGFYLLLEGIKVTAMAEKYHGHLQKNNPQTGIMPGQQDMLVMDTYPKAGK